MKYLVLMLVLLGLGSGLAQEAKKELPPSTPKAFDTYYMVFLKSVSDSGPIPQKEAEAIQAGHLKHLYKQHQSGQIIVAGPLEVDAKYPLRGLVLYPGTMSREAVEKLVNEDPAIKAGRLQAEIIKWWTPEGGLKKNL